MRHLAWTEGDTMTAYNGFIPPCGIYCGVPGWALSGCCHERRCKSFYRQEKLRELEEEDWFQMRTEDHDD